MENINEFLFTVCTRGSSWADLVIPENLGNTQSTRNWREYCTVCEGNRFMGLSTHLVVNALIGFDAARVVWVETDFKEKNQNISK